MRRTRFRGFLAIGIIAVGVSNAVFVPMISATRKSCVARHASFSPTDVATMKSTLENPDFIKQAEAMGVKDLEPLKALMDDPEKFGELQQQAAAVVSDLINSDASKKLLDEVLQKLDGDSELEQFFKDVKEDRLSAIVKYAGDDVVQSKLRAAYSLVREEMIQKRVVRNSNEEWIQEIFTKFDKDQDGTLSLDEFNELQVAVEGPDATYTLEQLQQLLHDVNPDVKDADKGMVFADFRKMYVDGDTCMRYTTDLVADHAKVFGENIVPA